MTGKYWDRAWSLIDGCTPCSPGCDRCWAMAMGKRFHRWPEKVQMKPYRLETPWGVQKPTVWAIWNDLFHADVTNAFIDLAFATMAHNSHHTFLVLTKRAKRMAEIMPQIISQLQDLRIENVWLGVTVCNQAEADEKIPLLLQTPAAHRWVSIEPMLGPVDLTKVDGGSLDPEAKGITLDALTGGCKSATPWHLNAVILGAETGPGARPMHPEWVRTIRDQCEAAGVPFYFKGWGKHLPPWSDRLGDLYSWPIDVLMYDYKRLLDGHEHNDLPWRMTPNKKEVTHG